MQRVEREQHKLEKEKTRIEKERLRALEREARIEKMKDRLSQPDMDSKFKSPVLAPLIFSILASLSRALSLSFSILVFSFSNLCCSLSTRCISLPLCRSSFSLSFSTLDFDMDSKFKSPVLAPLAEYKVTSDFAKKLHQWEMRKGIASFSMVTYYESQLRQADHLHQGVLC
jgi:hypothetical protein